MSRIRCDYEGRLACGAVIEGADCGPMVAVSLRDSMNDLVVGLRSIPQCDEVLGVFTRARAGLMAEQYLGAYPEPEVREEIPEGDLHRRVLPNGRVLVVVDQRAGERRVWQKPLVLNSRVTLDRRAEKHEDPDGDPG